MSWTEASTIQLSLLEWAEEAGWERVCGENLPRVEHDVVIDSWAREALLAGEVRDGETVVVDKGDHGLQLGEVTA